MSRNIIKFTGDIMSNMAQNEACRIGGGYGYDEVFERVKPLLSDCDYCVGNLETPLAGEKAGYSGKLYSFNTPDEFAGTLRSAGFDMLATANNHCLDRGYKGLVRTLDVLDGEGIEHTGTYKAREARDEPFVRDINGISLGFVSYTYGTNAFANRCFLTKGQRHAVNLFQPQETLPGSVNLLAGHDRIAQEMENLFRPRSRVFREQIKPRLEQFSDDVAECRRHGAEFVVAIMHSGGQYNPVPDPYTEYIVSMIIESGADMIIGHHPHVVHRLEFRMGRPVVYSLGNFSFTPSQSPESRKNPISSVSLVLSAELVRTGSGVKVDKLRFNTTCSVEREDGKSVVVPMYELINETGDKARKSLYKEMNQNVVNTFLKRPRDVPVRNLNEYRVQQV